MDVPTNENYDSTSLYFLMLTNISELRKDVLKYYYAAVGKQTVSEVYFSQDEKVAVIMFSCEPSAKRPGEQCYSLTIMYLYQIPSHEKI